MGEDGVRRASSDEQKPEVNIILGEANRIRQEGNEAFRSGDFKRAASTYTRCLDCITNARTTLKLYASQADSAKTRSQGHATLLPPAPDQGIPVLYSADEPTVTSQQNTEAPLKEGGEKDKVSEVSLPTSKQETLKNTTKIYLDTLQTQVLCNRALCNIRLRHFDLAEEDCTAALTLDPSNIKALYRRACAREELKRLTECMCDLQLLQQRGRCLGEAADIRQQQQMLRRVREKLLREEQLEREQQQPQALIAAALSTNNAQGKDLSAAERVVAVKKATALVHASSGMRMNFLQDGGLLRVAEYLAEACEICQEDEKDELKEMEKEDEVDKQCKGESVSEKITQPPITPALEAACWQLLLRCVVDERAEEKQRQHKAESKMKISRGRHTSSSNSNSCSVSGKRENMSSSQDAYAARGCLRLLRQKWTNEQLLLRLRRLLYPGTKKQIERKCFSREIDVPCENGKKTSDTTRHVDGRDNDKKGMSLDGKGICREDDERVCAADVHGVSRCKQEEENEKGKRDSATDGNSDKFEREFFRMRATCSLLRLMGQLEEISASCFEDDTAFCTGCLVGMQCTSSTDVKIAAIDAAAGVATARRTLPVHEAPVLALRHNIEKWLEELLQQYEELVQSGTTDKGEMHLKDKNSKEKQQVDISHIQLPEESSQREHLQTQIECLLVTLLSLLVDKNRALPPLFAAAQQRKNKGERDAARKDDEEQGRTMQNNRQKAAEADTDRLLEQLLAPYLPLSMSTSLGRENSSCEEAGNAEKNNSTNGMKKEEDAGTYDCTDSSSIENEEVSERHRIGCTLIWKGDDVEEAIVRQIVGLKVLRLLLPAAREEVSRFLMNDACGILRFAVAAAADDEGVRLAHTPRMLWLQQQAAAADLLIPAMDFPELRQKLLHIGGLQALASALSSCCNETRNTEETSCCVSVSAAAMLETAMSWVLCGKVAAVLARLAVHHENIRVEIFDFVNFYDVLSKLLQHWEHQKQQQRITGKDSRTGSVKRVDEFAPATGKDDAAAAAGSEADVIPSSVGCIIADSKEDEICHDFSQVFCFVSLHASFKQRLTKDEGGMLPRLVRLVDTAFLAFAKNSNTAKGKCSSNRNMILFLLLQGLSNLMKSRDDRRRRPRSSTGNNGGPQLDEEQQQQLEEFFSQLPPEAQPPRNGQIDAGDSEVARSLKERLAECGVVRVLSGVIMSNMKAAATAAAQKEEEAEQYNVSSSSIAAAAAAAALQQQLSPNTVIAAVDVLSALSAPPVHRGCVVQEGGLRTLLAVIPFLQKDGSTYEAELRDARQAVARLCISANPSLLTYQETHEAITYVVPLLRDQHELLQYEAALAVTNLTSSAVEAQNHAWHIGAWSALEDLLFSENPLLRAAGLEGWCNLAASYIVQDAIGSRCEELWQAERQSRISAVQDGAATEKKEPENIWTSEQSYAENTGTHGSTDTSQVAVVSSSQYEMQYIKILLAYCLEDENMRARHAAIAALAMLVADCRTAAAVVRASNFTNLLRSLDDAELVKPEEKDNGSEKSRYAGDTLILRIVATLNQLWATLKEADDKRGCNFQALTEQIRKVLVRNNHKLTGVSSTLAEEVCAN